MRHLPQRALTKTVIASTLLIAARAAASATPASINHSAVSHSLNGKASTVSLEDANRKGSSHVGGAGQKTLVGRSLKR